MIGVGAIQESTPSCEAASCHPEDNFLQHIGTWKALVARILATTASRKHCQNFKRDLSTSLVAKIDGSVSQPRLFIQQCER